MNVKLRFVEGDIWANEDRQPGDAQFISFDGVERAGLYFICPQCHHLGGVHFDPPRAGGWKWDGNVEAPTVTPSILHDDPAHGGRCGWHGYLTAGELVPCA